MTKKQKASYDRQYREKNRERVRAQKAAHFKRTYDPAKAAEERKKKMPEHVEYCRQQWYRDYKREYDKRRRSSKFGEFAAAHQALIALQKEIRKQMPDRFERYSQAGRHQFNPINQQRRCDAKKWLDSFGL